MTRAAIYVRISADREGAHLAVDRQERDCRDLCARHDWTVRAVYSDNDVSAYSGKPRLGYRRLLDDIGAGLVDVVVAWHLDRLHRRPVELEEYITLCDPRDVPTHTVKAGPLDLTNASGRMAARIHGAVSRYEIEHMIERRKAAKLQAAGAGRWRGGRRPYGYDADGVTVRPAEANVIQEIAADVLAGRSLRGISAKLNRRGVVTSTGGPWRPDAIRSVLIRPRNAALIEVRGQILGPAQWPAILDPDTFAAVRAIVTDPARRTQFSAARKWMLSGIATCGVCGVPVHCTQVGSGILAASYACKAGKHVVRIARELDSYVSNVVIERLSRPDAIGLLARPDRPDTSALHVRAEGLRARLDGLAEAYADGSIDLRQLREGSERVRALLAAVNAEIADAGRGSVLSGLVDTPDVRAAWEGFDLDRKRAVINALMTITIERSHRGRPPGWRPGESYFDPNSITITPR